MRIFEYPYIIITVLVMFFIAMGVIALYFTVKSVRTAKGTAEKSFCGIAKIENDFEKYRSFRKNCCLIYVSLSLDDFKRLYTESKALRIYEQIKRILLSSFGIETEGDISVYGKDGFVAFNSLDADGAKACIEACWEKINGILTKQGAVGVVGMSFGYLITTASELDFKTALTRAKQACSMAEHNKELSCQWDVSSSKNFERSIKIENTVQSAIDDNRFFLEYQPILDAKELKTVGAEVLSRLNSETDGIVSPLVFLAAVNNLGLNEKFDYYVFEKRCKWIASDRERRMKYFYTVNFSRNTLSDPKLSDNIIRIAEQYGISCSCIAVEILEDKNVNSAERQIMTENLKRLKEKGVFILLDDFGKGCSGFGDLADFDIDVVKVDKELTQNAVTTAGATILKNIINTAHELGFKILCEGIETEEHKNAAIESGADLLQGYYFYRPMPVTQFEALFDK